MRTVTTRGTRVPLHPQCQVLLDGIAQAGGRPMTEMSPSEAREMYRALAIMEQGEEVARVDDRHVPRPDGSDITVRVYTPQGFATGEGGVLVWFHGGGWVIGGIDTADATCRKLANRSGVVVASVDYRLAPEAPAPAALDDCLEALMWVVENAEVLGVDATRVAVGGDSAGGNLAALVCQRVRDDFGPAIAFQLLVYPVTDLTFSHPSIEENAEGYLLTKESLVWFRSHYLASTDPASPTVSPLRASALSGLPPALVITAEFDPLRDEGEAYAVALRDAGVPVEAVRYSGQIHGFFGLSAMLDDGKHAIEGAAVALRTALS